MKVVFFGTGEFAVPALKAAASSVTLVVSQPDRPQGRGLRLRQSPVKVAALGLGLPVKTPESCRAPEFLEQLRIEHSDALIVASYGQILSQAVLDSARRGGINLHGSILPKYRGAAPIQRAILAGEVESGVTLMQMDRGMDTGDVIDVVGTPIGSDETYSELQARLAEAAAELLRTWLGRIEVGKYPRAPQNPGEASLAPKITRDETELRFERAARDEYDRFRAFTDLPGAFLRTNYGRLRIAAARLSEAAGEPGRVVSIAPKLTLAFARGALELSEVQPEGKKRMTGREFANGKRLVPGKSLMP